MSRQRYVRLAKAAALLALVGAVAGTAMRYGGQVDVATIQTWVRSYGAAAPLLFMALYAVATVLFLPGSVITLAGGALFGPVLGTLYSLTGATLGATAAFLLARVLGAAWLERRTGGRLRQIKQGVEAEGWRFVAFTRLVPLIPFNALNYALGLTRLRLSHYVMASYVFMLPGAVVYTYLGYAGRAAIGGEPGFAHKLLLALALLAAAAFLPRLVARLRRKPMLEVTALRDRLASGAPLLVLDVRSQEEFVGDLGHVPGARNLPVDQLPRRLEALQDWREQPVAIVCRTDRRSAKAAGILARNGFRDVHVVRGGMESWTQAGFATEHTRPRPPAVR